MTEFQLSDADRHAPLWLRLRAHLESRLAQLRRQNDDPQATEQKTAVLRGRIGCLKEIIALGDERPVIPTDS